MTELSKGRQLHQQALDAQEAEKFPEALYRVDDALIAYDGDDHDFDFAEGLAMRSLTESHLATISKKPRRWLITAKHNAIAGVELARESGDQRAEGIPLFQLAKILEKLGDFDTALKNYDEAIGILSTNPPDMHGGPASVANVKMNREICAHKNGNEGSIDKAEAILKELEDMEGATEYERKVWLSGGHLKLAEAFRESDPKVAKEHLEKARAIIESDPKLTLRKKEFDTLAAKFA